MILLHVRTRVSFFCYFSSEYVHADTHAYVHAYIHTYVHVCMHACMHAHTLIHAQVIIIFLLLHTYAPEANWDAYNAKALRLLGSPPLL